MSRPTQPTGILGSIALWVVLMLAGCAHTAPSSEDQASSDITMDRSAAFQSGDIREIDIPGTPVSFQLTYVPAGSWSIGSPESEEGREADEGPATVVELGAYWIGRFEVTDDAFSIFRFPDRDADTTAVPGAVYRVDAVSRPSPPYEDPAFGMGGTGKPAVGMTQWGALHYAKWLTEKTGVFFRLPTEAEWETACRAGTNRVGETVAPQLTDPSEIGWFEENSRLELQAVGSKRPNAWQIHDMLGNASEWMLDEYVTDYHAQVADQTDPWIQPSRLHPRTVRGGAYDDPADALRCGARLESTTDWKRRDPQIPKSFWWNTDSPFLGFRLVAPAEAPSPEEQAAFWVMVLGE